MSKKIIWPLLGVGIVVLIISVLFKSSIIPRVQVSDQVIRGGQVTIAEVDAVASSWLVIQTETNGTPGPVIGYTKINQGTNKNVVVQIDAQKSTPKLFAMIHEDNGEKGKFDFPNNDMPLLYKGEMVSELFTVR